MGQEEIEKAYETGRRIGKEENHLEPSPKTIEMVSDLKIQLAETKQQMKDLCEKVDSGFKQNSEEHKEIMSMMQKALDGKAGVWTESVIKWTGVTIATLAIGVIGFLLEKILF